MKVDNTELKVVMSEAKRRKYTVKFKTEAVRLQRESDKTIAAVAQELGIHANLLARWCREEHCAETRGTTRVGLKVKADELVKLRRENELLRKEIARSGSVLSQGTVMRYQAISENVARFPVSLMCRCLEVSKAGFYAGPSTRSSASQIVLLPTLLPPIRSVCPEK